jgi:peptidoglycan/xylan/chitin deacetylase (PgdA/CDA1 family)
MFYIAKTPNWIKRLFKHSTWQMAATAKSIYLTFDDGPHPSITPFVLDELKKYNAKATFFCIGKNVFENPLVFNRILSEKHAVGNHTHNHLDGWTTPSSQYFENIIKASQYIDSDLFRPPYGRITAKQHKQLRSGAKPFRVIMWSVLSGDFDVNITPEACYDKVLKNTENGSIVVFHDSEKAYDRMKYALPRMLEYFAKKGYLFEKIEL